MKPRTKRKYTLSHINPPSTEEMAKRIRKLVEKTELLRLYEHERKAV